MQSIKTGPMLRDTLEMNESVRQASGRVGKNKYEGIWKTQQRIPI